MLIPAHLLANGRTVYQRRCDEIEYWHVELDTHDVIIADGLLAETYLDTGNRAAFANGGTSIDLHPDFTPHSNADSCMPVVVEGPALADAKATLLARAEALGHQMTDDDEMHIVADGRRVEPVRLNDTRAAFVLPAGCIDITLRSRVFVPAHTSAALTDCRSLGVYLERLQLDGDDIALEDDAVCADGWHRYEDHEGRRGRRWTTGSTPLPANTQFVMVDFAGHGNYWSRRRSDATALFA